MARHKLATSILEARGAFKRHPERRPKNEPVANGSFPKTPPRRLNNEQKKCWREIVKHVPSGVLTDADVFCVEIATCLLTEYRKDPEKMNPARIARLTTELGKLGLSPSDRTKLSIDKKQKNDFDDV